MAEERRCENREDHSRIWDELENQKEQILDLKAHCDSLDTRYGEHLKVSEAMASKVGEVSQQLIANGGKLDILAVQNEAFKKEVTKEIAALWSFPLKVFGVIVSVGAAGSVLWALVEFASKRLVTHP